MMRLLVRVSCKGANAYIVHFYPFSLALPLSAYTLHKLPMRATHEDTRGASPLYVPCNSSSGGDGDRCVGPLTLTLTLRERKREGETREERDG